MPQELKINKEAEINTGLHDTQAQTGETIKGLAGDIRLN